MNEPTLRQLRYFVALAEDLHFADAAAACGVSQPNLSAQIRELEKSLGGQLVERTSRHVLLTDLGKRVAERARRVLMEVDDLLEVAVVASDPLAGRMRLGVIPTIAPYVLPRVLPAVRHAWPELELQLLEDFTGRLLQRLTQGEIDVALLALPVDSPSLRSEALVDEPFVVVSPKGHHKNDVDRIDPATFDPTDLLLLQEGHCLRDQALNLCHLEPDRRDVIEGSSLTTLVQMVANGLGTTLLPLIAVPVDVQTAGEIVVTRFEDPAPGRTLGLVWRRTSSKATAFEALADLFRVEISRLLKKASSSLQT